MSSAGGVTRLRSVALGRSVLCGITSTAPDTRLLGEKQVDGRVAGCGPCWNAFSARGGGAPLPGVGRPLRRCGWAQGGGRSHREPVPIRGGVWPTSPQQDLGGARAVQAGGAPPRWSVLGWDAPAPPQPGRRRQVHPVPSAPLCFAAEAGGGAGDHAPHAALRRVVRGLHARLDRKCPPLPRVVSV